ncbi:hypothetical protein [Rugamonas sp.]|uniref:hypothetical protein n=1 Tax=Rugamonas sp. TaxID=1926287 RepID=UPI0025E40304|nr:hypothetical protein [Rugamonas sp.]
MNISSINNNNNASPTAVGGAKSSGADFASMLSAAKGSDDSPEAQLAALSKMTPEQRMRAAILAQMGIKESDLANMSPADRQAVIDKINAIIKQQMQAAAEKGKVSAAV